MKYSHVIFDLDGTLVDSATEIHEAAVAVCSSSGLSIPSLEYIRAMTGSPPTLFFMDHGCNESDAEALVGEFRGYLATHAGHPSRVFSGVMQLLEYLRLHDIRISLATTKPSGLAAILLERYGLAPFFSHVQGTDLPLRHKPHPDILHACMQNVASHRVVMVGDTIFDVKAAHNAGIDSIAVSTGAHSSEKLSQASPTYLCAVLTEIPDFLELSA